MNVQPINVQLYDIIVSIQNKISEQCVSTKSVFFDYLGIKLVPKPKVGTIFFAPDYKAHCRWTGMFSYTRRTAL